MNKKIEFTKLVAAGNDFVMIDGRKAKVNNRDLARFSRNICDRKFGAGADGLLVLEKSEAADFKMRIFNADGSEAEMCGNGSRCFALYCSKLLKKPKVDLRIQTLAGIIAAHVNKDQVRVNLTKPTDMKLDIPVKIEGRTLRVNYINTGVPHAIIFAEGLSTMEIIDLGRQIRYHKVFAPKGTNVDFVEVMSERYISIRTYERGVEGETLACGTGSVASALITGYRLMQNMPARPQGPLEKMVHVRTWGGEVLNIYFTIDGNTFSDVWLQGRATEVYKGVWYV